MDALVRYGRILDKLSSPDLRDNDGIVLLFEQYNLKLSHKHYLLAMFCLLSLRPRHKGLAQTLWGYIRRSKLPVKGYIYRFAQFTAVELSETTKYEERTMAHSIATRRKKAPNYKGEILAINIQTKKEIVMVGPEEMRAAGFDPRTIYGMLKYPKRSLTHKGHVFVRLKEK